MALSLEAIYQPLNDFFLTHFQTGAGAQVMFRFDKFGSVISEQDFIDARHPEAGPSAAMALEKTSELVNYIPADAGDGMSIAFRQDAIDTAYFFRMLAPSQAAVVHDGAQQQALLDGFGAIKSAAMKIWQDVQLESSTGLLMTFKPALARPANWYEHTADVWTSERLQIGDDSAPAPPVDRPTPPTPLWKLMPDNEAMLRALRERFVQLPPPLIHKIINAPDPGPPRDARIANLTAGTLAQKLHGPVLTQPADVFKPHVAKGIDAADSIDIARIKAAVANRGFGLPHATGFGMGGPHVGAIGQMSAQLGKPAALTASPGIGAGFLAQGAAVQFDAAALAQPEPVVAAAGIAAELGAQPAPMADLDTPSPFSLHNVVRETMPQVDIGTRLRLNAAVDAVAPAVPAAASQITVAFDYCLVRVQRPWLVDAFLGAPSWWVPSTPKGTLSSTENGLGFALMPIAFVAVRKLNIEANWDTDDLDTAATASNFGPFKVLPGIVENKLSHPGIQIVGWIVQRLPALPPNDPPA